jgi:trimethylamine:corrinoid methyltransferase-like protein
MKASLRVLSDDERARIHERSLEILANTGMRVDTARGRRILERAGAQVDENARRVRFPRALVEESLAAAPRNFTLGARRPGYQIGMNDGDCVLLADGTATDFIDPVKGERRTGAFGDWLKATRLIDTIDEIGVHWPMVIGGEGNRTGGDLVNYWRHLFGNFSKHVQETLDNSDEVPWFLEVLQVIFGDRESIRRQHPVSYLLNPQSPLIMVGKQTGEPGIDAGSRQLRDARVSVPRAGRRPWYAFHLRTRSRGDRPPFRTLQRKRGRDGIAGRRRHGDGASLRAAGASGGDGHRPVFPEHSSRL